MALRAEEMGGGPGNEGYAKNMEAIGFHDLENIRIFQMAMHKFGDRYYLYCAGRSTPICPILDVTDPQNPVMVNKYSANDNIPKERIGLNQKTMKNQAADGLLINALCCSPGPGGDANAHKANTSSGAGMGGIQIYDIKTDPVNPKFLGSWDTGVKGNNGVHRFYYNGGRYVHMASEGNRFEGLIYRIVDIEDPSAPVEVGNWWLPNQFVDGYPGRTFDPLAPHGPIFDPEFMQKASLHGPPFVLDDVAYCGYSGEGLIILDVKDVTRPKLIGQLKLQPPFSSYRSGAKTHTALPLPGRNLVVVTNEGERFPWFSKDIIGGQPQAVNNIHMVDVSNLTDPILVGEFPYPEVPENYPWPDFNNCGLGCNGPLGPHNIHEPMSNKPWLDQDTNRIYCCYFHAGMRVYDTSNQFHIKELAYFIPPTPTERRVSSDRGPLLPLTEDVIVDDRGNIFMSTYADGLYVLRMTI